MLQMADARTSGTAVTRIFSILEVNGRDEQKAFEYMKKKRRNVQLYTKSGGGGTLPAGLRHARAPPHLGRAPLETHATRHSQKPSPAGLPAPHPQPASHPP